MADRDFTGALAEQASAYLLHKALWAAGDELSEAWTDLVEHRVALGFECLFEGGPIVDLGDGRTWVRRLSREDLADAVNRALAASRAADDALTAALALLERRKEVWR